MIASRTLDAQKVFSYRLGKSTREAKKKSGRGNLETPQPRMLADIFRASSLEVSCTEILIVAAASKTWVREMLSARKTRKRAEEWTDYPPLGWHTHGMKKKNAKGERDERAERENFSRETLLSILRRRELFPSFSTRDAWCNRLSSGEQESEIRLRRGGKETQ